MGHIRVMSDQLANQIAAGEVVDRPASALKELLENSFDAGASEIRVFLEAGGKRRIRVEDNGSGMDRDDCLMALERHATSKLTRAEDLFSIKTLGFRGEALPSIASVSRFTLESRPSYEEAGVRLEVAGSKLLNVTDVSRNPGTTITIDNLFYNIPARKNFLRTTETELSWMVNLVTQYSIAHLDKHFYLEHNGKALIDVAPVKTLKERVYQHFGKRLLDHLVPFQAEVDWLKIEGLTSTPDYFKTNRSHQYLFTNGRMVKDRVINHAITAAYQGFGDGPLFPVVFMFVDVPPSEVDVNVHPAKTEIKFIHADIVHDQVRLALRDALVERKLTIPYRFREGNHASPSTMPLGRNDPWRKPGQLPQNEPAPPTQQQAELPGADAVSQTPLFGAGPEPARPADQALKPYDRLLRGLAMQDTAQAAPAAREATPELQGVSANPATAQDPLNPNQPSIDTAQQPQENQAAQNLFAADPVISLPRIIGQFRDSYILAEQEGDLLLIDQHVAHERILYDKITAELAADQVQRQALLVPITVELSPQQAVIMERILPHIRKFGFDLDAFDGNTYMIREVPISVMGQNLERMVCELVDRAQGTRSDSLMEAIIDHFAATKACKAAVKINMKLTPEKMRHLLERLWASSSPLFCPHGRPIILRFKNDEIERNFLRR